MMKMKKLIVSICVYFGFIPCIFHVAFYLINLTIGGG